MTDHIAVLEEMFAIAANERRMKEADACAAAIALMRAPVGDDTKRMDWLVNNVTETLTARSIQGEFPYPEHKTQYVLPTLIAWADFCGQITFREAIDYKIEEAMQQTTKEGGE